MHRDEMDAGHPGEQLGVHVQCSADPRSAIGQLVRFPLGECDQFGGIGHRQ